MQNLERKVPGFIELMRALRSMKMRIFGDHKVENIDLYAYKADTKKLQISAANLLEYENLYGFKETGILPVCYPHLLISRQHADIFCQTGFPFPLVGLNHVKNEIKQYRPILSTEVLDLASRVGSLTRVKNGYHFELLSSVCSGRELLWESTSTFEYLNADLYAFIEPENTPLQFAEIPPNSVRQWQLTPDLARRYARISKDFNPVHFSSSNTQLLGHTLPIAHCMYLNERMLAGMFDEMPPSLHIVANFLKPVFLPSFTRLVIPQSNPGKSANLTNESGSLRHITLAVTDLNYT
jgi:hypothetical protein